MILNSPYISGSLTVTGNIVSSGSITMSGSIDSASFATTASFSSTASSADNFFVRQNVTASNMLATGRITAQTLVVQTVTSSIVYSSGSNIFGNLSTDVQQMTGSLRVSGSTTATSFITDGSTLYGVTLKGRASDNYGAIGFYSNNGVTRYGYIQSHLCNNGQLNITADGGAQIIGDCRGLLLQPTTGNVGIGTTTPNRLTELISSSGGVLGVSTSGNGSLILYGRIAMYSTAGSNTYIDYGGEIRSYSGAGIDYSDLRFYTAAGATSTEKLRITSAGIACFACQVCAPQASFVAPYVQNTTALNAAWAGVGGFTATLTCASNVQPYATYTFGNGNVVISTNNPTISFQTLCTTTTTMFQIIGAQYLSSAPYNPNRIVANNSSHIALEAGAAERMRVDSGGNVGIGTCCPGYKLDVYNSGATSAIRINSDTAQNSQLRLEENGTVKFAITYVPSDATARFYFAGAGSDFVTLKSGNFGIACTSPAYPLHVNGQIYSSSTISAANSRILNLQSSNTWTDNSPHSVATAIAELSGIIRIINNLDGTNTDIPFYASGGSGVAYQWTVLDPDTGWLINQSGWNFNFTTNGSSSRTFNLQASNGSGTVTIQQSTGTANYTMKIFNYAGA